MDLQINSKSRVPVHVQLEEQIKHLILAGVFEVGSRLPSIREMAGYLRINRNTVARVISDLEREGFVESRRGSGVYVVAPPVNAGDIKRHELMERVIELAASQQVPLEDLGYSLLARAGAPLPEKVKILFVECTAPELEQFTVELEAQLPVEVEPVLLEDLGPLLAGEEDPPWRFAVTTFFHVHEVQELMEPRGVETVALLAETTLESLQKLTQLPENTRVGVVGYSQTCMENLSRSMQGAGLDHLNFIETYLDKNPEEVKSLFHDAQVLICSTATTQKLRDLGVPRELEILEEDRTLDQGGVEMLSRMLRQPAARQRKS